MNPYKTTHTATIANGASLSGAIELGPARAARVDIPATWTTADLTFQVSYDGTTYNNLYQADGTEYKLVVGGTSRSILLDVADFLSVPYLKIRSGTAGAAVNQGAARELVVSAVL